MAWFDLSKNAPKFSANMKDLFAENNSIGITASQNLNGQNLNGLGLDVSSPVDRLMGLFTAASGADHNVSKNMAATVKQPGMDNTGKGLLNGINSRPDQIKNGQVDTNISKNVEQNNARGAQVKDAMDARRGQIEAQQNMNGPEMGTGAIHTADNKMGGGFGSGVTQMGLETLATVGATILNPAFGAAVGLTLGAKQTASMVSNNSLWNNPSEKYTASFDGGSGKRAHYEAPKAHMSEITLRDKQAMGSGPTQDLSNLKGLGLPITDKAAMAQMSLNDETPTGMAIQNDPTMQVLEKLRTSVEDYQDDAGRYTREGVKLSANSVDAARNNTAYDLEGTDFKDAVFRPEIKNIGMPALG